ncbi:MAG: extensin family protein [Xanthobacteraceae bacterium]
MAWGARFHPVRSAVLGLVCVLAGCTGSFFAEREPWRREAEVQCLTSGAIKEGAGIVRIAPINGPGTCGADFPLRVSVLGESAALGFADDPRPPAPLTYPRSQGVRSPAPAMERGETTETPVSLSPRSVGQGMPSSVPSSSTYDFRRPHGRSPEAGFNRARSGYDPVPEIGGQGSASATAVSTPVAVSPAATLACPIISELERWIATAVQPSALRWFGSPVVEIRQISAYSCRGMNGNPRASISEHAFGNALDIASFTLADGRTVSVKGGWNGLPEEQGFLRDVQGAACEQFTTVLAPGSNVYHYDHIHVDLMRRSSGHRACNPGAVSGEEVARRAAGRYAGRRSGEPAVTGSLIARSKGSPAAPARWRTNAAEERRRSALPLAQPGSDGFDGD